jgi:uncharacterized protein (TIGR01777 family)
MNYRILMTGGTGFIGSALCAYFLQAGHHLTVLTRSTRKSIEGIHYIQQLRPEDAYDIVINLAGAPINQRWTIQAKKMIEHSRIETTQRVIDYIKSTKHKPRLLISGSAIGYYGTSPNKIFDETSADEPHDFAQQLCHDWEATALQAKNYGVRVCLLRTGVVLGKKGGMLKLLLPTFRLGLGAIIGEGQQWLSWIHISDLVQAIALIIQTTEIEGPVNLTAPQAVSQQQFAKTLAHILKRPCFLRLPQWFVTLVFGEMGKALLLQGQQVRPKVLQDKHFNWQFPTLDLALRDLLE